MTAFNHVVELGITVSHPNWNRYRHAAANWLIDSIGDSGSNSWDNIDVPIDQPVTLGFESARSMRMFLLWSELQGVPCHKPKTIQFIVSGSSEPIELQVNL